MPVQKCSIPSMLLWYLTMTCRCAYGATCAGGNREGSLLQIVYGKQTGDPVITAYYLGKQLLLLTWVVWWYLGFSSGASPKSTTLFTWMSSVDHHLSVTERYVVRKKKSRKMQKCKSGLSALWGAGSYLLPGLVYAPTVRVMVGAIPGLSRCLSRRFRGRRFGVSPAGSVTLPSTCGLSTHPTSTGNRYVGVLICCRLALRGPASTLGLRLFYGINRALFGSLRGWGFISESRGITLIRSVILALVCTTTFIGR